MEYCIITKGPEEDKLYLCFTDGEPEWSKSKEDVCYFEMEGQAHSCMNEFFSPDEEYNLEWVIIDTENLSRGDY